VSEVLIRAAFEQRLNAMSPALSTAFENVPFTPVNGTPYQRVTLLAADPENPSIGASLHRAIGIFQVSLFYPVNAGPAAAWTRAQLIRTTFPRALSMASGGVTVHVTNTPAIALGSPEPDRYSVLVRIPYHASIFS
jgi:hypothetical protein